MPNDDRGKVIRRDCETKIQKPSSKYFIVSEDAEVIVISVSRS